MGRAVYLVMNRPNMGPSAQGYIISGDALFRQSFHWYQWNLIHYRLVRTTAMLPLASSLGLISECVERNRTVCSHITPRHHNTRLLSVYALPNTVPVYESSMLFMRKALPC